jgi:uncharacterized protein (TIGR00269 family)
MAADPMREVQEIPSCSFCSEPAVIFQRDRKRHLCSAHLTRDIEERVAATINAQNLIAPGDCVAVGLSGGKDSTALLLLLQGFLGPRDDIRLVAITIDEGIAGYREETVRSAERLVTKLGIEHHTVSFTGLFGDTLDGILKGREQQACSICGILRKKALITGAERAGATKLATGHNLDDEAQSVLMNVLRGDLARLARNSSADSSGRFIPRIKPLMYIHDKEIAIFLLLKGEWSDLPECPYACHALRREVRVMLGALEYEYPGTMLRLMESKKMVENRYSARPRGEPIRHCAVCGDPCSGELCQLCQLRRSLGC